MLRVALVSSVEALDLDDDLAPLRSALEAAGTVVEIAGWEQSDVDWGAFDVAVLRSAWNYPQHHAAFLKWVEATSRVTEVLNGPTVIRWNSDKTYLFDLVEAGVPTVPTIVVRPGEELGWPDAEEVVVKPTVSAGSRDTARFESSNRTGAQTLVASIWSSGRSAMIQPYLRGVDDRGEQGYVFFAGELSHSFRKGPMLQPGEPPTGDLFAPEEIEAADPTPDGIEIAESAVRMATKAVDEDLLYARVDLADDPDTGLVVLELELVEPSVYHAVAPGSAERFAEAIVRRPRRAGR